MKLWIDDVRPAPEGYLWIKTVSEAKNRIIDCERLYKLSLCKPIYQIELLDLDHDAGDYTCQGGDYIRLLDWLEQTGRNYPIRIHSMNVVGRMNMEAICRRNGWKIIE